MTRVGTLATMKKPTRSKEVIEAMRSLLKSCERMLTEQDVVEFDEIRELRRLQTEISTGESKAFSRAIQVSLWGPLLHYWRHLAAKELDRAVGGGLPKTTKARRRLAQNLRLGWFGMLEHSIRDTVRYLYPIRRQEVSGHERDGKTVKSYARVYGDPSKWPLPESLLSEEAHRLYRYVLEARLPKKCGWNTI